MRDALIPLGVTTMSAGSHTEPGGYTGAGRDDLHLTVRGRRRCDTDAPLPADAQAEGQFDIADTRSPPEDRRDPPPTSTAWNPSGRTGTKLWWG